jgi:hypothetical protein
VIELLPDEWPIHMVENYFIQAFRKATDEKLQGKIVLGLSRGENLMVIKMLRFGAILFHI